MALQGSGAISMDDMRTEFGISGAISMSDLYRGGSEVPSSATSNQGGTVTIPQCTGSISGDTANNTFTAVTSVALPVTSASGDVITAYGGTNVTTVINNRGSSRGVNNSVFLGNSDGTSQSGSALASFNKGYGDQGTSTGTITPLTSSTYTLASNQAGATHVVYKITGGPGYEEQETYQGTMTSTTMTITQNRTSNVNTGVPASGTITFSDLYGAEA